MRIWKVESAETDHICGDTLIEALQEYLSQTGCSLFEFSKTDDIVEVPESEWGEAFYNCEDRGKITFKQHVELQMPKGLMCSTAF